MAINIIIYKMEVGVLALLPDEPGETQMDRGARPREDYC